MPKIEIYCKNCKSPFLAWASKGSKFCSSECYHLFHTGKNHPMFGKKHTPESIEKIKKSGTLFVKGVSSWNKDIPCKEETKTKLKEIHKGKRYSPKTEFKRKEDKLGYRGLHNWVEKHLGKPTKCEHCDKDGLTGKQINWANKSQEYREDINDWIRLCVKCHRIYDKLLKKANKESSQNK